MRRDRSVACVLVLALTAGCSTSGVGSGLVESPGKPDAEGEAVFTWTASSDGTDGTIAAVLPDGRVFRGSFLQATSATVAPDLGPPGDAAWGDYSWGTGSGWAGRGYGWRYGAAYDHSGFVREYSGRMLAQLDGPRGERMRCFFVLARPEDGPASGGTGECQLSTGEEIDYATLRGVDD